MIKFSKILALLILFFFAAGSFSHADTVRIISEDAWYPYSGNTDKGIEGIAVDIVREAFKAMGVAVEFEAMNYDRGMLAVKDGQAVGCFDTVKTKETEDIYLWHDEPMFSASSYFYASKDYPGVVSNVNDLTGKKLGLTQGYEYGDVIDLNNTLDKEYSKTDEIIIKKLIAKRVDFIILYDRVAEYLITQLNVQGEIKPVGLSESSNLYVAFSKKHPDGKKYCDIFSSGLRKIMKDGTYQKIFQEWEARLKGASLPTPSQ